jgi:putative FmdB family regulatory protein
MPVYEFECPSCGKFEVARRYEEVKDVRCPACKGEVRRIYSPFGFSFGWRLTDRSMNDMSVSVKHDEIERNI